MAITTIEGYTPMSTGRIALGADGSIWRYQPNVAGGMLQLEPPGTIAPMTAEPTEASDAGPVRGRGTKPPK